MPEAYRINWKDEFEKHPTLYIEFIKYNNAEIPVIKSRPEPPNLKIVPNPDKTTQLGTFPKVETPPTPNLELEKTILKAIIHRGMMQYYQYYTTRTIRINMINLAKSLKLNNYNYNTVGEFINLIINLLKSNSDKELKKLGIDTLTKNKLLTLVLFIQANIAGFKEQQHKWLRRMYGNSDQFKSSYDRVFSEPFPNPQT
jgi:hypothetical protein